MIELNNVTLYFGQNKVFDDLSVSIPKGARCCISGASGKGKSTLLKIIQGFVKPQLGNVIINDEVLSSKTISSIRNNISWVPQNIDLPVESGIELMNLLKLTSSDKKLIGFFIEKLGLNSDILEQSFKEVSGGQKQRIVLAICMAKQKPILILDEPTSSLDDLSISFLINLVNSLDKVTVVSTSHNDKWVKSATQIIKL
ncbi:MAG: ATP-binding cassette domain-containing protein [Marinilabiliaceae bacterium]|nr:ATP-binding cassette domain-containing protein [Marinilabiliaceae bacterium]